MTEMHFKPARRFFLRTRLVACAVFFIVGCPGSKEALIPVSGTIRVNKQALASGTVVFHPDPAKGNPDKREPRATIAADLPGRYRLITDGQDGAPSGWYKVTLFALKPAKGTSLPPEWLADPKYADEKTSGLSVEVVKDTGTFDFELDPPPQ